MRTGERGSVLILVLWVLFFLAALTVAVGAHVSSAVMAGERFWSRCETRALAEAGAHLALAQVVAQTNAWDGVGVGWNVDEDTFRDREVGDGTFSVYSETVDGWGLIVTNMGVIGEDGKLNVNMISKSEPTKQALLGMLTTIGKLNAGEAQAIVAAIEDWIDADDEILTGGAESGYYSSLSPAYLCANGPMKGMAELRMVKGMSSDLYARLAPHVTVYGGGLVNINCASESVLTVLAEACAADHHDVESCGTLAAKIVRFQQAGNAFETSDAREIRRQLSAFESLSGDEDGIFLRMMGSITVKSQAFRGVSTGMADGERRDTASVEFVCDTETSDFVYWREWQ